MLNFSPRCPLTLKEKLSWAELWTERDCIMAAFMKFPNQESLFLWVYDNPVEKHFDAFLWVPFPYVTLQIEYIRDKLTLERVNFGKTLFGVKRVTPKGQLDLKINSELSQMDPMQGHWLFLPYKSYPERVAWPMIKPELTRNWVNWTLFCHIWICDRALPWLTPF